MPIEKPYADEGKLPEPSVIESFIGRPLFDGDIMYPKTVIDFYDWHGELYAVAPIGIADFILGYLDGSNERMLAFRRAEWDVSDIVNMTARMDDRVSEDIDNPFADESEYVQTGIARMSYVAELGLDRAFALAISGLTAEQLIDIGKHPEKTIDMPGEYFEPLYPAVHCEGWEW